MIWERGKTNVKRMPGGEKGKTENHSILCTWELLTGCRKTIGEEDSWNLQVKSKFTQSEEQIKDLQ
jgi:hypothetical protein